MNGVAENLAAALSLLLMGACGVQLLLRLTRVLRGQERPDILTKEEISAAPGREVLAVMGAALLSRLAVCAIAYGMYRALGGGDGPLASFAPLWTHWDVRQYIGIAQEGYTAVGDERLRLVFFPLYPLLMRLLSPLTGGDVFAAGTVISLLCGAGAAGLLYALAYPYGGRRAAGLSTAYFLLSPLSVFLGCVYTEALFLCLTLGAMLLLRRGHPWLAALCGLLSAFTRMPGVIIAGLFFIDALGRWGRRTLDLRGALCSLGQMAIVFAGLLLYWGINAAVTGDPFAYVTYQRENWFQEPGTFWNSVHTTVYYVRTVFGEDDWLFLWVAQAVCMFGAFALLAFGQRRLPFDWAAYAFVYTAVVLAPTWLLSGPRYLFAMAPWPLMMARLHDRPGLHAAGLALSGLVLILWIFGYTIASQVL